MSDNQQNQNQNRRFGRFSNQNNNQNPPNQNQNANAAGSRFSRGSRFGGNNNQPNQNQNANTNNNNTGFSRFGQQIREGWTVAPLGSAGIRISLDGLGDPLHRLLGTPLNVEYGDPQKVAEALQNDPDLLARLEQVLDEAWHSYDFKGAAMLYPWNDGVKKAFTNPIKPNNQPQRLTNNGNNEDFDYFDDEDDLPDWLNNSPASKSSMPCMRAIDAAFVLNVLARTRANVIVSNTPLALEASFLTKSVVCDDSRILKLARATGCLDEAW